MTVIPEGEGQKPVVVTVPNKAEKSRLVDPPDAVVRLAAQLRIGDEVRIRYDKLGTTQTFRSAQPVPSSGKPIVFAFASLKEVRHGKADYQAVVAGSGRMSWTFLIPNVEPPARTTGSGSTAGKSAGAPSPDPALLKKVSKYRRGDEVYLTYEPHEYTFALQDIETVQHSAEGILQASTQTTRSRKTVRTLHILTDKQSILLFVPPAGAETEGDSTPGHLLGAVKGLKPKQKVAFKYRTEGGLHWLDEISVR